MATREFEFLAREWAVVDQAVSHLANRTLISRGAGVALAGVSAGAVSAQYDAPGQAIPKPGKRYVKVTYTF